MKTTLGFLTEEGRTRGKNALRRICIYVTFMFVMAGAGGYGLHRYWVSSNLTALQRVYFKQYLKSSYRSYLPNSRSRYTTLGRIVTNPQTKKDISLAVHDEDVVPVIDETGRIQFDQNHYPKILLKSGIEHKKFLWEQVITSDKQAYEWFRREIYASKSIPDLWRPAWIGALAIFLVGTGLLIGLDLFAQARYLKGEPLRGTRELLPKAYAREHRKHIGYSFNVYRVK